MRKIISASASVILTALTLASCSLKYEEGVNIEDRMPELVFTNADLTRYKDGKLSESSF